MSLLALLKKELHWSKRNVLLLLFLLLVIPLFFAGVTTIFQDVVPRDTPVAVVAADEDVNDTELTFVEAGINRWTEPTRADSRAAADELLTRESVYAIVVVPPDYLANDSNATFRLVVDGTITPYQAPSEFIRDLVQFELRSSGAISDGVTVEREMIRQERNFAEYLYPTFMLAFLVFVAFTYVPFSLRRDGSVIDRLRVEASLESVVTAKLLFLTALMIVPLLVFHLSAIALGYGVASASPWAFAVLLLTFLTLSTVSLAIMILTRFTGRGQFINLIVMLGVLALSALVFPLGFFSPVRTAIAQLLPTHYAMIVVRSLILKDVGIDLFTDWLLMLVGVQLLAIVALEFAIVTYRRRSE